MEFTIRPMRSGDGEGISRLRRMPGVFENVSGISSERVEYNEEYASSTDPNCHNFIAETQDTAGRCTLIGCAGLTVCSQPRLRRNRHYGSHRLSKNGCRL